MTRTGLFLLCALGAACDADSAAFSSAFLHPGPSPAAVDRGPEGGPALPTWTILIYGHGDHDLSSSLLKDLAEMASARIGPGVQVIVFADWNAASLLPGQDARFPAGAFWYRVPGQGQELERFREEDELDFDDPAVLSAAVERAFSEFPADRHGLVLWDHGGAWSVGFGGDSQDGRRAAARGLPIETAAAAIERGLVAAGLPDRRALDFLGFDACLMGGAESVSAFQRLTQVFIADAELDYGDGWDYEAMFTFLSDNRSTGARELAAFEVETWDAHHRESGVNDLLLRSHVAIDTSHWSRFVADTRTLVEAHRRTLAPERAALALARSLPAYKSELASPHGSSLRDLGNFLEILATGASDPVAAAARAALSSARQSRIALSAGAFREQQLGIHVFGGPPLGLPPAEVAAYPRLARAWSAGSAWPDLLAQLRGAADGNPPVITGRVAPPSSAPTVSFEVTGGEEVRLEVTLLRAPTGPAQDALTAGLSLGIFAGAYVEPGNYDFVWTGRLWRLAAPSGDVALTIEPWIWRSRGGQLEAPILASRGLLRSSSGEELEGALLIDAETLEAAAILLVNGGRPAVHDLLSIQEADPGVAFFPLQHTQDLRTGTVTALPATAGVLLPPSGSFALRQTQAEPGSYLVLVRASDVWGNERGTLFPVQLAR